MSLSRQSRHTTLSVRPHYSRSRHTNLRKKGAGTQWKPWCISGWFFLLMTVCCAQLQLRHDESTPIFRECRKSKAWGNRIPNQIGKLPVFMIDIGTKQTSCYAMEWTKKKMNCLMKPIDYKRVEDGAKGNKILKPVSDLLKLDDGAATFAEKVYDAYHALVDKKYEEAKSIQIFIGATAFMRDLWKKKDAPNRKKTQKFFEDVKSELDTKFKKNVEIWFSVITGETESLASFHSAKTLCVPILKKLNKKLKESYTFFGNFDFGSGSIEINAKPRLQFQFGRSKREEEKGGAWMDVKKDTSKVKRKKISDAREYVKKELLTCCGEKNLFNCKDTSVLVVNGSGYYRMANAVKHHLVTKNDKLVKDAKELNEMFFTKKEAISIFEALYEKEIEITNRTDKRNKTFVGLGGYGEDALGTGILLQFLDKMPNNINLYFRRTFQQGDGEAKIGWATGVYYLAHENYLRSVNENYGKIATEKEIRGWQRNVQEAAKSLRTKMRIRTSEIQTAFYQKDRKSVV